MDEGLSWRARLAKANINILSMDPHRVFIEFTYHPKPGIFKWCKTYIDIPQKVEDDENNPLAWRYIDQSVDDMVQIIMNEVLELRKELED